MEEKAIVSLLSDLKHRIFPRPFERLAISGEKLIGVEIGVYRGEHAESILKYADIERLYLVDPYELYSGYYEGHAHYGVDQDPLALSKREALDRLAQYANRISWIYKKSSEALGEIPDNLDFVYIDGNHDEVFVREDMALFYPKIREKGILGGHDFYNGYCREHDGVVRAVTHFAVQNNLTLQVELPDWWLVKEITERST